MCAKHGVSAADSANYCAQVIMDKPSKCSHDGDLYKPTFVEVYGQGAEGTSMSIDSERVICVHACRMDKHGISTKRPASEKRDDVLRRESRGGL